MVKKAVKKKVCFDQTSPMTRIAPRYPNFFILILSHQQGDEHRQRHPYGKVLRATCTHMDVCDTSYYFDDKTMVGVIVTWKWSFSTNMIQLLPSLSISCSLAYYSKNKRWKHNLFLWEIEKYNYQVTIHPKRTTKLLISWKNTFKSTSTFLVVLNFHNILSFTSSVMIEDVQNMIIFESITSMLPHFFNFDSFWQVPTAL